MVVMSCHSRAPSLTSHTHQLTSPSRLPIKLGNRSQPAASIWALFSGSLILCDAKIIPQTTLVIFQGDHYCLTKARRCAEYQLGSVVYTDQWMVWRVSIKLWPAGTCRSEPSPGYRARRSLPGPYRLCRWWRARRVWRSRSCISGWTGRNSRRRQPPPSGCCRTSSLRSPWPCRTSPWTPASTRWCRSPGCARWPWKRLLQCQTEGQWGDDKLGAKSPEQRFSNGGFWLGRGFVGSFPVF